MRIALIHNAGAGDGAWSDDALLKAFREAGHQVDLFGKRKRDLERAIGRGADVLAVAGGDGTVAATVIAASAAGMTAPLLVLAVGTSNNIARSLGVEGPPVPVIQSFASAPAIRLDVGAIRVGNDHRAFVEAAGVGFIGTMLEQVPTAGQRLVRTIRDHLTTRASLDGRKARGVARLIRAQTAVPMKIIADGEDLSGEYLAAEVMNIRDIGPRVTLAPGSHSGDGMLDLVLIREHDRGTLADYVASQERAATLPCGQTRRVRSVEMTWPERHAHVDDAPWSAFPEGLARVQIEGAVNVLRAGIR